MQENHVPVESRLGVVAIFIEDRLETAPRVNQVLSDYGEVIVGRMGIPYRERNLSVIAVIADGTTDEIGAMTGKLGAIVGVSVKSALRKKGTDQPKSELRMQSAEGRNAERTEPE
jgi:putative iron-only hydrogenase system regulator